VSTGTYGGLLQLIGPAGFYPNDRITLDASRASRPRRSTRSALTRRGRGRHHPRPARPLDGAGRDAATSRKWRKLARAVPPHRLRPGLVVLFNSEHRDRRRRRGRMGSPTLGRCAQGGPAPAEPRPGPTDVASTTSTARCLGATMLAEASRGVRSGPILANGTAVGRVSPPSSIHRRLQRDPSFPSFARAGRQAGTS